MTLRHGTRSYYVCGCRCDQCRMAATDYARDRKARVAPLAPDDPRHGTINGYSNYGCRCGPCTRANADKGRRQRQRQAS